MSPDALSQRIAKSVGKSVLPRAGRVDVQDALQVDRAAAALLRRFQDKDDREAFELLVALAQPLLDKAARAIAHDLGLAVHAEELVGAHLARLFVDLAPNAWTRAGGNHFLRAATRALQEIAEARLAELRAGRAWPAGRSAAGSPESSEARTARARKALARATPAPGRPHPLFVTVFSAAFHALERDERRALLYKDVDGLSYAEIGRKLRRSADDVGELIYRARRSLGRRLSNKFRALEADGKRRP